MDKNEALAKFLKIELSEVEESRYDSNVFEADGGEYKVLTDAEADEAVEVSIFESLWAFRASFLVCHMVNGISEKAIQTIQNEMSEDAGPTLKALILDLEHFVNDAVACDGRGHFLSQYDGEESELGEYFIYRVN